jgi:hypothetical protein
MEIKKQKLFELKLEKKIDNVLKKNKFRSFSTKKFFIKSLIPKIFFMINKNILKNKIYYYEKFKNKFNKFIFKKKNKL